MNNAQSDTQNLISIDALPPVDIARRIEAIGISKAQLSVRSLVLLGVLGGVFIGLGGALATLVLTDNSLGFGLSRLVAGLAFSLGLILLVVGGGELYTGNSLMVIACANRRICWSAAVRNWVLTYPANAAGAIILAYVIHVSGIVDGGGVKITAIKIAEAKAHLSTLSAFVRAILCNILVCLAVWLSTSARSVEGKVVAIMLPISAFVALGFEHCIANFYLIPIGILSGAQIELHEFLSNIAIVTVGNAIGGAIIAAVYYRVYLSPLREVGKLEQGGKLELGARLALRRLNASMMGTQSALFAGGFALVIISAGWLMFSRLSSY